ncbi:MAG: hypothetical protein MJZ66_09025 [Bacteroidales bacterium]|nr:hypothetical protein [Bacteroidales bacterium]
MKQNSKIEFHIPLVIALALLCAVCIPLLQLPFCQSESQLFSDSIMYITNHGIGPVNNGKFVELPELFSLIFSQITTYITGDISILHAIAMISALMSIYVAYKFGKFFFSVQAGVMAASLMTVQNVFLAQSGLCLPQMMLNASILGSIYMFFREKYGWCTVLTCIATMIDITGLATSLFVIISYLRIKYKEWSSSKNVMLSIPIILWFLYELASLIICGRYSIRTISFSPMNFVDNLYFVFVDQYRFVVSAILLVAIISNLISKNIQYFVREMAKDGAWLLILLYLVNSCFSNQPGWNLTAVSLLAILTGCAISNLPISYYSKYIIACALMAVCSLSLLSRDKTNDGFVNYKSAVKVDKKTVELIEKHLEDGDRLMCDKHFERLLKRDYLGYRENKTDIVLMEPTSLPELKNKAWAVINAADTTEAAQSIRQDPSFSKLTSIYVNGYMNEIYRSR